MAQTHANLHKILSWANAGYKKGQVEGLSNEQIAAIDGTTALMQKMVENKATDQDSKAAYQLALTRLAEYRAVTSRVAATATTDNAAAAKAMLTAESKFQVVMKTRSQFRIAGLCNCGDHCFRRFTAHEPLCCQGAFGSHQKSDCYD